MLKKRIILMALCGKSPGVITETVYTLVKTEKLIPDEVIVITSKAGKECISSELFKSGVWQKFIKYIEAPKNKLLFGQTRRVQKLVRSK